jgi:alanine racemase
MLTLSPAIDLETQLSYVTVDLDAIAHNLRAIRAQVGPEREILAVVKANAYGHGLVDVARTALRHGATRLAVSRVGEGEALRMAGVTAPVLVMGYSSPSEAPDVVANNLTVAVGDWPVVEALNGAAGAEGRRARVHIKVDTGMGRFGLLPEEVVAFLDGVSRLHHLHVEGIFTHFATADAADKAYTLVQFARFNEVVAAANQAGHTFALRHAANSAAILDLPETHLDAVRPGIILYGLYPSTAVSQSIPLKPALAITSRVGRVRTLPAGASIGYDRTYITPHEMPVALVPVGYGDGYPRFLTGQAEVLINGRRAPLVGRVCMDQFVVDISDVGPVQLNDEVVLLGQQEEATITAEELADRAGTINYHIVTNLLPRLPRVYLPD